VFDLNPNLFCRKRRKDSAPPRVSVVSGLNTGVARKDLPPGTLKIDAWRNGISVWRERVAHPPSPFPQSVREKSVRLAIDFADARAYLKRRGRRIVQLHAPEHIRFACLT
jgi:hypothetical protein